MSEIEQQPIATNRPVSRVGEVLLLGDLCFGASYGRTSFRKRGFDSAFRGIAPLIQHADFVFANLETTLTSQKTSPIKGKKRYIHKDDPEGAEALRRNGIHAVSLANNHAFDYGSAGLTETLDALSASGITAIGAGPSMDNIDRTLVHDLALKRGSFRLAIAVGKKNVAYDYPYYVGKNQAGIVGWTSRSAAAQIRKLRKAEPNAFIIAFPHWGSNYSWMDNDQRKIAHSMIRAGADLIVGHGAHCLQEIELVEGRWVLYSIGNSVFNTGGSFGRRPDILPYSFIARFRVKERKEERAISLRLYPILSDNRRTKYCPRFVTGKEMVAIKEQLVARSSEPEQLKSNLRRRKDEFGRYFGLRIGSY